MIDLGWEQGTVYGLAEKALEISISADEPVKFQFYGVYVIVDPSNTEEEIYIICDDAMTRVTKGHRDY